MQAAPCSPGFLPLPCHLIHSSERDEGARFFGRNPAFDSTLGGYKLCILWKQRVKLVAADDTAAQYGRDEESQGDSTRGTVTLM